MILIGITGKKGHGKDTIAEHLVKKHNYIQLSFAQPLKEVCKTLFSFTDEQLYGDHKEIKDKYWGISPREAFQYIGTDLFRNNIKNLLPHVENDFWIICLQSKLDFLKNNCDDIKIVISDVRFVNEANFIKKNDGLLIKVIRNFDNNKTNYNDHISETTISDINADIDIHNNNTINNLYNDIDEIINK